MPEGIRLLDSRRQGKAPDQKGHVHRQEEGDAGSPGHILGKNDLLVAFFVDERLKQHKHVEPRDHEHPFPKCITIEHAGIIAQDALTVPYIASVFSTQSATLNSD